MWKRKLNIFLIFFSSVLLAVSHNNCTNGGDSRVTFSSPSKGLASIVSNASGNGDGYLGKPLPGTYIRSFANYDCLNAPLNVQSTLDVTSSFVSVTQDNCNTEAYNLSFTDSRLEYSNYNKDYLGVGAAIFELTSAQISSTELPINEAWCRESQNTSGLDVVIKVDSQNEYSQAKLYLGNKNLTTNLWSSRVVSAFSVNRSSSASGFQYLADGFSLQITNANLPLFTGHVTTKVDGLIYDYDVNCRMANPTPVLTINTNSLVGLWQFEGGSSGQLISLANSAIVDSSGNANHATAVAGSAISYISSIFGLGLFVPNASNANTDYLTIAPSASTNNLSALTISAWVNLSQFNGGGILEKADLILPTAGWRFGIGGGSDKLYFYGGFSANPVTAVSSSLLQLNQWINIIVTWDGTNNSNGIKFYKNGTSQVISTTTQSNGQGNRSSDTAQTLKIGYGNDANAANGFKGQMDEISLWNRVLSDQEIQTLLQKGLVNR